MYKIEEIIGTIINSDCIEAMKQIPDNSIDLVVTSPPYNCGLLYDSWNDRMPWDDYYKWCEQWLKEIFRVLKDDGRFCLNHYLSFGSGHRGFEIGIKKGTEQVDDDFGNGVRLSPLMDLNWIAVNKVGLQHHGIAVWSDRTLTRRTAWGSWLSASSPYVNSPFEGILILYKKYWKKLNKGESTIHKDLFMKLCSGVWDMPTDKERLTIATFPLDLPIYCINLLSYKNDIILDPFSGSGTTCLAAEMSGRRWVGIDISEDYCKTARLRIKEESDQVKMDFM